MLLALAAVVPAVALAVLLSGVLGGDDGPSGPPKAVIVDQLSLTAPNPSFSESATATLKKAGYIVDYVASDVVTVDFYRTLPEHGYDLVILRNHSTAVVSRGDDPVSTVSIFTNEPYSKTKYYDEQAAGRLGFASYTDGGDQLFGITAAFVRDSMQGDFDGTVIIMMGCDGLKNDNAANAFLARGASSYVSWSEFVTASHTDAATERLLSYFVTEKIPLPEAVTRTNDELGPDPTFGSELLYRLD